jgi:hypothetical protein
MFERTEEEDVLICFTKKKHPLTAAKWTFATTRRRPPTDQWYRCWRVYLGRRTASRPFVAKVVEETLVDPKPALVVV